MRDAENICTIKEEEDETIVVFDEVVELECLTERKWRQQDGADYLLKNIKQHRN